MKKLVPLILGLVGLAAGAGAGLALRPAGLDGAGHGSESGATPDNTAGHATEGHGKDQTGPAPDGATAESAGHEGEGEHAEDALPDYVKLSNQFVVPVVEDGKVVALVILSLSLEITPGATEAVYAREPRLRDEFLQVLFDHANAGGFRGSFTDGANLLILRRALAETAHEVMGEIIRDVLISDIVRQDN